MKDLLISIKGEITASNFYEWQTSLIQYIDSTNTELVTDEDFANADGTVKTFKAIEKRLDTVKQSALDQSHDIICLFKAIDSIKSHVRETRLVLNRQLTKRKKEIRLELIDSAIKRVKKFINSQEGVFPLLNHKDILQELDFELAIKGKSSLTIAQFALDRLVQAKIKEVGQRLDLVALNERRLSNVCNNYHFLFHDKKALLLKATDDLDILISNRVLDYKEKETKIKTPIVPENTEGKLLPEKLTAQVNSFDKVDFIMALECIANKKNPFSGDSFPAHLFLNNVDFFGVLNRVIEELKNEKLRSEEFGVANLEPRYIANYFPKRNGAKHDEFSRNILILKNTSSASREEVVCEFFSKLEPIIPVNCLVVSIPSSDPANRDRGISEIIKKLCHEGRRKNGDGILYRRKKIVPAHFGGLRNVNSHLDTMAVSDPSLIAGNDVVLLDDVVTSGSSFRAAAIKLNRCRAMSITLIAIGKTAHE
jgi:hypothetical protein